MGAGVRKLQQMKDAYACYQGEDLLQYYPRVLLSLGLLWAGLDCVVLMEEI